MAVSILFPLLFQTIEASLFCFIHTATPNHDTRAATVATTWARLCDNFVFFTDSPMERNIPHIYWPELYSRDHSWEKIRRIMREKYDWYLRADDDAYVVIPNLRAFLSGYSSTDPHYFGYKWNFFVSHGYADGGAYVLSYPTLMAFAGLMNDTRCSDHHRAEEDQELAKCLELAGIYPEDTRDRHGSDRFHHFHPLEHLEMDKDQFARRFAYYEPLKGKENFSPQMISFHHVSPYEMRIIDFIFNGIQ